MKPKLSQWASIAEITSSVAVVVTLIVLVIEVKDNTGAMQAATRQSTAGRIERLAMETASNPDLAALIVKDTGFKNVGTSGEYTLSETLRVRAFLTALLRNAEEAYFQMQEGRLDESYFQGRISAILAFVSAGGGAEIYCSFKATGNFDSGFTARIDNALMERYGLASNC